MNALRRIPADQLFRPTPEGLTPLTDEEIARLLDEAETQRHPTEDTPCA